MCVEPWAGGAGGPPLHPPGWAAGQMSLPVIAGPASDRRSSGQRSHRVHTRAQTACSAAHPRSGRDRASPTRRRQPRAWQPGRQAWPLHRAFLCGRLAAEPYPLPTAPRAAPAARACPSPASREPARPSAIPGVALAPGLQAILWLHHGRPKKIVLIARISHF